MCAILSLAAEESTRRVSIHSTGELHRCSRPVETDPSFAEHSSSQIHLPLLPSLLHSSLQESTDLTEETYDTTYNSACVLLSSGQYVEAEAKLRKADGEKKKRE